MIRLKDLVKEIVDALPPPPPSHVQTVSHASHSFSPNFINYIKAMENPTKIGYRKGKWYPFALRGGTSIGYGHVVKPSEMKRMKSGLSDREMERLLIDDLNRAKSEVYRHIRETYKVNLLLSREKEEMLVDFVYNMGNLKEFPKFTIAVLRDQKDKMRAEYKRHLAGMPLTLRNKTFYDRYLK